MGAGDDDDPRRSRANVRRHRAAGGGAGTGPSGTLTLVYDLVPRATFTLIFCTTIHVYEE